MKPTSRRLLAAAALASVLLTGCGVGDGSDSSDADPDAEPSVAEPDDEATDLEGALAIGDTYEGDATTTVESVLRGKGGDSWVPAGGNFEWLAATVSTCVSAGGSQTEVGWYQWAATGPDGAWYPADLDYDGEQPSDQYPLLAELAPGECAEGQILIPVPRDAELITLINADRAGVPQGTWLMGDVGVPAVADGA